MDTPSPKQAPPDAHTRPAAPDDRVEHTPDATEALALGQAPTYASRAPDTHKHETKWLDLATTVANAQGESTQSAQEALVKLFCSLAMGAPFVFVPDNYLKGSASREPADIAWACNGCLVLIYLCRGTDARKAQRHNLAQIKGWLRAWRKLGKTLHGHNKYSEFSIRSADPQYQHVVILSIIECADATAEYHHEETKALNVTMFATLPFSAIQHLVQVHASMLDALYILNVLRIHHKEPISERDMQFMIASYKVAGLKYSRADTEWIPGDHDSFLAVETFLYCMRALPPEGFKLDDSPISAMLPVARIINDLTLADLLILAIEIKSLIDRFRARSSGPNRPPRTVQVMLQHVPLMHYDVILCGMPGDGPGPKNYGRVYADLDDFARQHDRRNTRNFCPSFVFFVLQQPPGFHEVLPIIPPQPYPSAIETFLTRCRAEQYS